jgi:hypothetical protein
MSPAASVPTRGRRPLVLAATLLALGVAVPSASAAPGVFRGSGSDAVGDAASRPLDILSAELVLDRNTGRLKGVMRMAARPVGDVDLQVGVRQANGTCATTLTLSTNVEAHTAELQGSAGNTRAKASLSYADVGTITASVTDPAVRNKTPSCATVRAYGAGANHALRDTLNPAFAVTERVAEPVDPGDADPGDEGLPPDEGDLPLDEEGLEGDLGGLDDLPSEDDLGTEGDGSGARIRMKVYGVPRRVVRRRTYTARIRLRNVGTEDATSLRVRLTRVFGVALSRRVAPVSRVRAGKGVTVHIRVRLTSRRLRLRTIPVLATGEGVRARTSIKLRRRPR